MNVKLGNEEYDLANEYGTLRTEENKSGRDIADYDHRRFNLTSLQANKMGVLAELAVLKFMGLPYDDQSVWIGYVPKTQYHLLKQPDVLGQYEVRRAHRPTSPLPIRQKDVRAAATIIQVFIPYHLNPNGTMKVHGAATKLLGWADAIVDWDKGETPGWSKNGDAKVLSCPRSMNTIILPHNGKNARMNHEGMHHV